jgi:hypothetical protein
MQGTTVSSKSLNFSEKNLSKFRQDAVPDCANTTTKPIRRVDFLLILNRFIRSLDSSLSSPAVLKIERDPMAVTKATISTVVASLRIFTSAFY